MHDYQWYALAGFVIVMLNVLYDMYKSERNGKDE
jgi:hypothetical protein